MEEYRKLQEQMNEISKMVEEISKNTKYIKEFMTRYAIPVQGMQDVEVREENEIYAKTMDNQEELDRLPEHFDGRVFIKFGDESAPALIRKNWNCRFVIGENYYALAYGSNFIEATENSTVKAYDNCFVKARGNANVDAYGQCHVEAHDQCEIAIYDFSDAQGFDNSYIQTFNMSQAFLSDNSEAVSNDNSVVKDYRVNPEKKVRLR